MKDKKIFLTSEEKSWFTDILDIKCREKLNKTVHEGNDPTTWYF